MLIRTLLQSCGILVGVFGLREVFRDIFIPHAPAAWRSGRLSRLPAVTAHTSSFLGKASRAHSADENRAPRY